MGERRKRPQSAAKRLRALRDKVRISRTNRANLQAAVRAVNKFRPRKAERMSFVFLSKNGKRIKSKSRLGYAVYVTRNGKKQLVDKLIKRKPKLRTQDELALRRTRKKTALKKIKVVVERISAKVFKSKTPNDFAKVSTEIFGSVSRLAKKIGPRAGTWRIETDFSAAGENYQIGLNIPVDKLGSKKEIFNRVWSGVAELLDNNNLVSRGSASVVYKANRGKRRDDWEWKGRRWLKRDNDVVDIDSFAWRINRLARSSAE